MQNKQIVGQGKFVAYAYKLYNDGNGEIIFQTPEDAPDVMVYGVSHEVVPGLIEAIKGLSEGDKFSVTLPPEAAFGPRYEENVIDLEKSIFMRDGELVEEVKVGAELPMMTQEGMMVKGRVIDITPSHVQMDFNHPFAGLTVRFEGEIDTVRDATPDELKPHACGCGCHHGGDDHQCGGNCGGECHEDDHGDCGCHGGCSCKD